MADSRMDSEQALEEARRRWGSTGALSVADTFRNSTCLVGELLPGPKFIVRGRGSSWEAAFADADGRPEGMSRRNSDSGMPLSHLEPT